jgi:ApbE superfamily uncharacterized protein (UPF0280 family)
MNLPGKTRRGGGRTFGDGGPTYRQLVRSALTAHYVKVSETDLIIYTDRTGHDVAHEAREAVIEHRGYLERYIRRYPEFLSTLRPWPADPLAPPIVQAMIEAGRLAGVGPMASVAGAVAEQVGQRLRGMANEVIVENGGDIFLAVRNPLKIAVFAGKSPLSLKIGIALDAGPDCRSVCTSSGTVGHSLSMGAADAVSVLSVSCALADATATAIGNRVQNAGDIEPAIQWGRSLRGIDGILIIVGKHMGAWGQVRVTPV